MEIPEGFAKVTHHFDVEGNSNDMMVTYGVEADDLLDAPQTTCDFVNISFATFVLPILCAGVHMNLTELETGGLIPSLVASPANTFGGVDEDMLPPDDSLLVQKRTNALGRRHRGRFYLPGVAEGSVSNAGFLAAPYRSDCQAGIDEWFDDVTSEGTVNNLVIFHSDDSTPDQIASLIVDTRPGNQRRRLR